MTKSMPRKLAHQLHKTQWTRTELVDKPCMITTCYPTVIPGGWMGSKHQLTNPTKGKAQKACSHDYVPGQNMCYVLLCIAKWVPRLLSDIGLSDCQEWLAHQLCSWSWRRPLVWGVTHPEQWSCFSIGAWGLAAWRPVKFTSVTCNLSKWVTPEGTHTHKHAHTHTKWRSCLQGLTGLSLYNQLAKLTEWDIMALVSAG